MSPGGPRSERVVRSFVALDFDAASVRRFESVGATLRSADSAPPDVGVLHWTPRTNLHLTVKFLGLLSESVVAAIAAEIPAWARAAGPIRTPVRTVTAFPHPRRAEVIVTEVDDSTGALSALAQTIEAFAALHGVPVETRAFRPHVTLARTPGAFDARAWLRAELPAGLEIACPTLALYRSDPLPRGAMYTAIARASLRA